MVANLRVGIIGTGFGKSVQIPGFRQIEGVKVEAICSGQMARAQAAAAEFEIPYAFDDYRTMLEKTNLDLVSIVSPVYLHHPMTLAAIEAGCHVICEKPMAMNLAEAREMYERAETAGVVHLIDHELRFNPTRMRIGHLLAEGYVGQVYHVVMRNVSNLRVAGTRHWDWWSQVSKGGGALGANGSHMVDLLRWWIGEIAEVSGQLHTYVTSRLDPLTGDVRPVDSDDQFTISARFVNGVQANVFVSYVAHQPSGNLIEIHGEAGSLVLDNQDRLWGRREGEEQPTELTLPEPLAGTLGLGQSVWALSFVHLAREAVTAICERRQPRQGATFYDGMRCQAVLDATRRSWQDRRWIEVEA